MKLSNNNQLYQYLISLSAELKRMGAEELGDVIATASRMVNTFPATEFLGESRMALQRVSREEGGILSGNDHAELLDVLGQLDAALIDGNEVTQAGKSSFLA